MNPHRWDTVLARALLSAAAGMAILLAGSAHAQLPPPLEDEVASRDASDALAGGQVGAVSADGRYVVFNNGNGLYRRDRVLGTTVRVDVDASNQPSGSPGPWPPSISPDGRWVSFHSSGTFGSGDANGGSDVYLKDLQTAAVERISIRTGGGNIDDGSLTDCTESSVSGTGNKVAFVCLEAGGTLTVFVRDRQNGTTSVASINTSAGVTAGSVSQSPSISVDGRYVGFVSDAGNLVAGDGNTSRDAFVRDLQTGSTIRVSLSETDAQIGSADVQHVDIAANCLAAFDSAADGIVAFDNNGTSDVYVRNWCDGMTELGSADDGGFVPTGGASEKPWLSDDGRYLAFSSNATLVVDADFTSGSDVYVRDRQTGTVARGNLESVEAQQFDTFAIIPRLSGDGRQLIYTASGSLGSDQIVAVRNPVAEPLPVEDVAVAAFGTAPGRDSQAASLTADGTKVVFVSTSQGFDRGWNGADNDSANDVFVYDYALNCVEQASMSDAVTNGDCDGDDSDESPVVKGFCAPPEICSAAIEPSIDPAGRFAVFVTSDAAVAKYRNETEAQRKMRLSAKAPVFAVVLRNLVTNATFRLGTATGGGTGSTPRVAPGAGSVVFTSGAGMVGTDTNGQNDVYRQRIKPDGSLDGSPECMSCKDGSNLTLPGGAGNPTINAGGTVVAFDQPNGSGGRDVLVRNLITGAVQRLGTTAPAATRNSTQPSLDWSGTRVAFQTGAPLVAGDANAFSDVYVYDVSGERLALMSGGNGPSTSPSFAGDGKSLAYVTQATNLDPAETDANGFQDVHVQQVGGSLTGGRRATLARNRRGALTNGASHRPAMSYNGTVVAFDSIASNMLDGTTDTNAALDVFVRSVPFNADRLFESGFE